MSPVSEYGRASHAELAPSTVTCPRNSRMPVGRAAVPTDGCAAPALTVPLTRKASPPAPSPDGRSGGGAIGRLAAIFAAAAAAAAAAGVPPAGGVGATPAR